MCSGKTTIAKKLSRITSLAHMNIDEYKNQLLSDDGYSESESDYFYEQDGIKGLYKYNKIFELKVLKCFLSQRSDCIFDMGAGFIDYPDIASQTEVFKILSNFKNTILLLPHTSIEKTLCSLSCRFEKRFKNDNELRAILSSSPGFDLNKHLVNFYFSNKFRFKTVFTYHKSITTIAKEIISVLK